MKKHLMNCALDLKNIYTINLNLCETISKYGIDNWSEIKQGMQLDHSEDDIEVHFHSFYLTSLPDKIDEKKIKAEDLIYNSYKESTPDELTK